MSPLFESIALMGAAYIVFASLWRLRREPAPAELGAMLARHGIDWGRLAAGGSSPGRRTATPLFVPTPRWWKA